MNFPCGLLCWVKQHGSESTTNNEAEYDGLISLLTYLQNMKFTNEYITICMDSKLVVEQMCGRWQVKSLALKDRWKQATRIGTGLDYHLVWVPREVMVKELGH
jgi:probable phosphoglycerate mutase